MKKNSILVNVIFYLALIFVVIKTLSSLFVNIEVISNFKIIIYILLVSVYLLLGYMYYKKYIKK